MPLLLGPTPSLPRVPHATNTCAFNARFQGRERDTHDQCPHFLIVRALPHHIQLLLVLPSPPRDRCCARGTFEFPVGVLWILLCGPGMVCVPVQTDTTQTVQCTHSLASLHCASSHRVERWRGPTGENHCHD